MSHSWSLGSIAVLAALSSGCTAASVDTAVSAVVCEESVSPDSRGQPRNAAGDIRYCWPTDAFCFCDQDDDCYAEEGYVPCTPRTDAGIDAAIDTPATDRSDVVDTGQCPPEPTVPDNQGRPRNPAGVIRYCWPGEARCFCDQDDDCYAEPGYVPCLGPIDSGVMDTGVADTGVVDTGVVDTGVVDTGVVDTGVVDTGATAPRIVIDTTQDRGAISRDLYGANLESTSQNVPEVRALAGQYPILRFPAGDEPAEFLWSDDNRGPCGDRWTWPAVADLAASRGMGLVLETNLLRGSPSNAANWIANARDRGLRVAWVNVGNEVWGDWDADFRSAQEYASDLRAYAAALRARVPGTRVAASFGTYNEDVWNREVVRRAGDVIDAVDLHWYPNHREYERAIPSQIMAESEAIPQLVARVRGILRDEAPARASQIEIILGEYDCAEDPPRGSPTPGRAYSQWGMPNAVCYGGILGELITAGIRTALYYEIQNARFGALQGKECEPGDFRIIRPKALAQQLYREHFGDRLVALTQHNIPTYYSDGPIWWDGFAGTAPYVRAYASLANSGRSLRVIVLSRHETSAIPVTFEVRGFQPVAAVQAWELAGDSVRATNENVGGPVDAVRIVPRSLSVPGATFVYAVPPHSVTALEFTRAP
ncbi:MAG: hypothetical protein EPO40_06950 [Myxococcaceae bacterium]|nr:MAG: hypothetical protein EPO40_06950 [Myxococcaceae bacterium]